MSVHEFISAFAAEFASNPGYYSDIAELLDFTITEFVSSNTIEDNKKLIDEFAGDTINAINLYNENLGELDFKNTPLEIVYQHLAHISIFVKCYPEMEKMFPEFDEKLFITEITTEYHSHPECYDDPADLLEVYIDDYVANNTFATNKQIVTMYSTDIKSAMQNYQQHLGDIDILTTPIDVVYEKLAFSTLFIHFYPLIS